VKEAAMDDDDRIISVVEGNRVLLCASVDAQEGLEVYLVEHSLRVIDRFDLLARIEGDGMRERVCGLCPPPKWRWTRREIVTNEPMVRLTTLGRLFSACVYVAVEDGKFVLTGGAAIVRRIETNRVSALLGLVDDRVL
jgi:hypothetical protein